MLDKLSDIIQYFFDPKGEIFGIIGVTMLMSFFSTAISSIIGIPLGVLLGISKFKGKKFIFRLTHTLTGVPPVVAGLLIFLLLSRRGPLGPLQLLFTVGSMVIAQVFLITPVVIALTASAAGARAGSFLETTGGLGLGRRRELLIMIFECRTQLVSVVLTAFGRSIAEVGAVSMVGGNIQFKTRVMTTAIMLETNRGNFELAIALGIVVLLIAFALNVLAQKFSEDRNG
jgi:tungstate transport system permease protein